MYAKINKTTISFYYYFLCLYNDFLSVDRDGLYWKWINVTFSVAFTESNRNWIGEIFDQVDKV